MWRSSFFREAARCKPLILSSIPMFPSHIAMFGGHTLCGGKDTTSNFSRDFLDHMTEGSCSSLYFSSLPSLVALGIVVMDLKSFQFVT